MSTTRFALASSRVVFPNGVRPATVIIHGQKIEQVVETVDTLAPSFAGLQIEHVGDRVIAPGVVDSHVHINEPGHTDWEGFETATKAAAAGGVTTLVDMPLNSLPVTTTVGALTAKRHAAAGKCAVDVGFYGGVIPGNADKIEQLLTAGALGIKAFLCHSGLDEFPNASLDDLRAAAPILAKHNRPLLVHAELTNAPAPKPEVARRYGEYLASRPTQWESDAIDALIQICRDTRCHIHIVHLSNSDELPKLRAAEAEGLPLTVETCPHYLHFTAEQIPEGKTQYKCAPPVREARHRDALWAGLRDGIISTIGSDHSPCPPSMKELESGNFMSAWGGIASLELTLPIVWTEAAARNVPIHQIFNWLAANPAKLVGLQNRKGRIAAGCDADLLVWNPDAKWSVRGEELYHRHKLTPYEGETLRGIVERTYLRGKLVFEDDQLIDQHHGELLKAGA
jgi:allantoinase